METRYYKKNTVRAGNTVRGFAIVCAIMVAMIVGVYWIAQATKSQPCECKCFDNGYLQGWEDLEKYLTQDLEPDTIKVHRSREDY